ncbi:GNAT family N-acetyltransferase [Rhodanobacter glycinis]|uniref:GNAT family N-acetyltransferase n=1 Tax=Rhodanobacter glycinis TaxID=582702 RepID=A0A502C686_9GAMM|nr:GNAT family N-acetyltransferase [Rhodanobacter glycinis]TPG08323.1 GNAT family N-acetyltransferase [Rhodanobacter glycinis]
MIRNATHDDIPRIVEMAQKFYEQTQHAKHAPMKKECAAGLAIITMQQGTMLVAEKDGEVVAMLCAFVDHFTFNDEFLMVNELAFWVDESARGSSVAVRLLKEARRVCKAKGVLFFNMAALATSPDVTGRIYKAMGLEPIASIYMQVLS